MIENRTKRTPATATAPRIDNVPLTNRRPGGRKRGGGQKIRRKKTKMAGTVRKWAKMRLRNAAAPTKPIMKTGRRGVDKRQVMCYIKLCEVNLTEFHAMIDFDGSACAGRKK